MRNRYVNTTGGKSLDECSYPTKFRNENTILYFIL